MKRHTKLILILAAGLGAIGLALCITALVLGVSSENSGLYWDSDRNLFTVSENNETDVDENFENVESLEIVAYAAEVYLEAADVQKVTVTASNVSSKFQCRMEGKTLIVKEKEQNLFRFGFFSSNSRSPKIHIQVPKETNFKTMDIEVGAGTIETYGFTTTELEVECGAGSAYLEGNVEGACKLSCGMGTLNYTGALAGKTEVACGMGTIDLELDNQETDFNYYLECGMGSITVGESVFSGFSNEQTIDLGGQHDMNIECGMGSVNISFNQ